MLEWRNVLSLLVRPRSPASDRPPRNADGHGCLREDNNRGLARSEDWPNSAGEGLRLWTISTEFLVETGAEECTRADRR